MANILDKTSQARKISGSITTPHIKNKLASVQSLYPKANPSILFITTFPPVECGIATFTNDLFCNLKKVFSSSFNIEICPIVDSLTNKNFTEDFSYTLNTEYKMSFDNLANQIKQDNKIEMVLVQHEFGLFNKNEGKFLEFLNSINKTKILVFHTVLPNPNDQLRSYVNKLANTVEHMIVMTNSSKEILINEYDIDGSAISVIIHGTHAIKYQDADILKEKYGLSNKTVLSTFGLIGPNKSIETTLHALTRLVERYPDIQFLIIGKTHPNLTKQFGEDYRDFLTQKVSSLNLTNHVTFINEFVALDALLEYLQLTDIYLFTSLDPNQAVSGTFSYAMACGCPIISTPIAHALECLTEDKGLIFNFNDAEQLAQKIQLLLDDPTYRKNLGLNGLHASASSSWENTAIAYARVFNQLSKKFHLNFNKPPIKFDHLDAMTTDVGLIQFCILNHPNLDSGYTLDDNARALIALCKYYQCTKDQSVLKNICKYLKFILCCQRHDGSYFNYVDKNRGFTDQNYEVNLEDSNGRAIWALGTLIGIRYVLPIEYQFIVEKAEDSMTEFLPNITKTHSTRAMAFIIKGLSISMLTKPNNGIYDFVVELAEKLTAMYKHERQPGWLWYESYLTYGNAVMPDAMLYAYEVTQNNRYKKIAHESFNFLVERLFKDHKIHLISNKTWYNRGDNFNDMPIEGQQAIDVTYTMQALDHFHQHFPEDHYDAKMDDAFSWFLGNNHLNQMVYNARTGGCHDGIEKANINLNQGAESTVSYLMARLIYEANGYN